ncbi:MAG: glycosyltransferase family 87 protein [Paracoccaceae bacterium]
MTDITSEGSPFAGRVPAGETMAAFRNRWLWPVLLSLAWMAGLLLWQWNVHAPDFSALYFAAEAFARGETAQVYAINANIFGGTVSREWAEMAFESGYSGKNLYPYIYPPLWAALIAPVTEMVSLTQFMRAGLLVQLPLVPLMALLAHRLTRSAMPVAQWMAITFAMMLGSFVGTLALQHNQPQLLVAFLILLAFERQRRGRPVTAGAALALAAAIKLYPLALTLLWLVRGKRAPVVWFAVFGSALGLLSIFVAGPELHAIFLGRIREISDKVVSVGGAVGLDGILYQFTHFPEIAAAFHQSRAESVLPLAQGFMAEQPGWIGPAVTVLLVAALSLVLRRMKRGDPMEDAASALPMVLIAFSLSAPLAWYHHILPAFLLLPGLIERLGHRNGALVLLLFCFLTNEQVTIALALVQVDFLLAPLVGLAAYTMVLAALWKAQDRAISAAAG